MQLLPRPAHVDEDAGASGGGRVEVGVKKGIHGGAGDSHDLEDVVLVEEPGGDPAG